MAGGGDAESVVCAAADGVGVDVSCDHHGRDTRTATATTTIAPIATHASWRDDLRGARGSG